MKDNRSSPNECTREPCHGNKCLPFNTNKQWAPGVCCIVILQIFNWLGTLIIYNVYQRQYWRCTNGQMFYWIAKRTYYWQLIRWQLTPWITINQTCMFIRFAHDCTTHVSNTRLEVHFMTSLKLLFVRSKNLLQKSKVKKK